MELSNLKNTLSKIPIWKGKIDIEPLAGGITNKNYLIKDKEQKYVARFGEDIKIFKDISNAFEIVFTHGDLHLPNILSDGKKLQLVDWEYSVFNSVLTDLASLSKHGELNQDEENFILEQYYRVPITSKLKRQFQGMKCASLLKESLWSMIAEIQPPVDYDWRQYTKEKLDYYRIEFEKFFNY